MNKQSDKQVYNSIQLITLELIDRLTIAAVQVKKMGATDDQDVAKILKHLDETFTSIIGSAKTAYIVELSKSKLSFTPYFDQLADQYKQSMRALFAEKSNERGTRAEFVKCGVTQLDNFKSTLNTISLDMENKVAPTKNTK